MQEGTALDSSPKDPREPQGSGEGCVWAELSPEGLAVLDDLQKQPKEGKEVAPSAEVGIKTHSK